MATEVDTKPERVDDVTHETGGVSFEGGEVGILDVLVAIGERKLGIFVSMLVCGLLGVVLAWMTSPTYTATAVIMPPQQSSSAAALVGQLGGLAGLGAPGLGIKNAADPYIGILGSRAIADELILQFRLRQAYGSVSMSQARKRLASLTDFNSSKHSLIRISVEDRDPNRAAALANGYVTELQKQNSRLAVTEAGQRRLFYERELQKEKALLAEAETALKRTQEDRGILQVSSQVGMVISAIARIRAEVVAKEVMLERLNASATAQNPEVQGLQLELNALRSQLKGLEFSSKEKGAGDPFLPTALVPEAGLEYARRLRELKYREVLFELLAKQYEIARIDEAKEAAIIQIVDKAVPPDTKTRPSFGVYALSGALVGCIFGAIWAILHRSIEDPVCAAKFAALRRSFSFGVQK